MSVAQSVPEMVKAFAPLGGFPQKIVHDSLLVYNVCKNYKNMEKIIAGALAAIAALWCVGLISFSWPVCVLTGCIAFLGIGAYWAVHIAESFRSNYADICRGNFSQAIVNLERMFKGEVDDKRQFLKADNRPLDHEDVDGMCENLFLDTRFDPVAADNSLTSELMWSDAFVLAKIMSGVASHLPDLSQYAMQWRSAPSFRESVLAAFAEPNIGNSLKIKAIHPGYIILLEVLLTLRSQKSVISDKHLNVARKCLEMARAQLKHSRQYGQFEQSIIDLLVVAPDSQSFLSIVNDVSEEKLKNFYFKAVEYVNLTSEQKEQLETLFSDRINVTT